MVETQTFREDLYYRLAVFPIVIPPVRDRPSDIRAFAEYFAQHYAGYIADHGPLGADVVFAIAAGVPGFVPGFTPHGTGFYTVTSRDGDVRGAIKTYEINRPDDPAHSFDPAGNGGGHHYIIRFGAEYRGWFGITTDELSCGDVPGICPERS